MILKKYIKMCFFQYLNYFFINIFISITLHLCQYLHVLTATLTSRLLPRASAHFPYFSLLYFLSTDQVCSRFLPTVPHFFWSLYLVFF